MRRCTARALPKLLGGHRLDHLLGVHRLLAGRKDLGGSVDGGHFFSFCSLAFLALVPFAAFSAFGAGSPFLAASAACFVSNGSCSALPSLGTSQKRPLPSFLIC